MMPQWLLSFKPDFRSPLSFSSRGLMVSFGFLLWVCCQLHNLEYYTSPGNLIPNLGLSPSFPWCPAYVVNKAGTSYMPLTYLFRICTSLWVCAQISARPKSWSCIHSLLSEFSAIGLDSQAGCLSNSNKEFKVTRSDVISKRSSFQGPV